MSGQDDKQNALRAVGVALTISLQACGYGPTQKLVLQRCVYLAGLEQEYRAMQAGTRAEIFEDMLGSSPQMQAVFEFIRKVAPTSAPVLILGSGTSKEDGGAGAPSPEQPVWWPVRRDQQLQLDPREPAGERTLRP